MHLKVNLIIADPNPFVQLLFASGLHARCLTPTHLSVHKSCFIYPANIGKKYAVALAQNIFSYGGFHYRDKG
jgi:hypothetical protein